MRREGEGRGLQERRGQLACPHRGCWPACMCTHSRTLSSLRACFLFFFLSALKGPLFYLPQHMLIVPTFGKLRQENCSEYEVSLGYVVSIRLARLIKKDPDSNLLSSEVKQQATEWCILTQRTKVSASKSVNLSSIPGCHRVKRDNGPPTLVTFRSPHKCCGIHVLHTYVHLHKWM